MRYEDLLTQISKSGPGYRWSITFLLSVLSMKSAFDMFVMNLATAKVPYHCAQVLVDNVTTPWSDIAANGTIGLANFSIAEFTCRMPRFWRSADGSLNLISDGTGDRLTSAEAQLADKCQAWSFQPDQPNRWTMFIEYEMVCDREYLSDRMQTVLQFGIFLSTLLGPLGDIVGRKPILVIFCYLNFACNVVAIFARDLTVQMALRFFMGCGDPALLMGLILITELVAENYRSLHGNMFWMTWVVAYCGSAAIGYYVHNWRHQMVVVVIVTGVSFATYIPVLPESPRWLLTRRKVKRAEKTLKEVCRYSNCKDAVASFNFRDNELVNNRSQDKGIFKCIPKENICKLDYFVTLAVVTFNFFTSSFVYHSMCFQRDFITKDPYLNVLISGLLEIPAYLVAWQMINRLGRKPTTLGTMCFCGLGLMLLPYVPRDPNAVFQAHSCLAISVKFSITVTFSVLNVYGSEVLPTTVRSCSLFFAFSVMGIGQFLAPELGGILSEVYAPLPGLLYGSVTVLAGLSTLLLPETNGQAMPNTVREMRPVGGGFRCLTGSSSTTAGCDTEKETDSAVDVDEDADDVNDDDPEKICVEIETPEAGDKEEQKQALMMAEIKLEIV